MMSLHASACRSATRLDIEPELSLIFAVLFAFWSDISYTEK